MKKKKVETDKTNKDARRMKIGIERSNNKWGRKKNV